MDAENIIDELRFSLEHIISEEELLHVITGRLTVLRQSFSSHRSLFTPSHIEFLKSLAAISDQLRSFIELREELADVGTLEDYAAMVRRLTAIKGGLAPFAVRKRVMKEIRELNEKLPTIREQDDAKRQIRVTRRILDLEQDPPHCRRNHAMVIREGLHGYFWGCGRYPFCKEVAQLTPEQKDRLLS
jgi:DNA repair exonuclease SbcCD ATPase subunit